MGPVWKCQCMTFSSPSTCVIRCPNSRGLACPHSTPCSQGSQLSSVWKASTISLCLAKASICLILTLGRRSEAMLASTPPVRLPGYRYSSQQAGYTWTGLSTTAYISLPSKIILVGLVAPVMHCRMGCLHSINSFLTTIVNFHLGKHCF